MKIDFTVVLKDQEDKPILDAMAMSTNGGVSVELTLGRAASFALHSMFEDERNLSGEDKFNRGMLAFKVRDNSDCELKPEDVALIKKVIGKAFSPLVVYRAYQILDK